MTAELGPKKDEFEVRVWTLMSKEVKHIENMMLRVVCDPARVRSIKNLRVTNGDFHLGDNGVGEWRFSGKVSLGWTANLRGRLHGPVEDTGEIDESPVFPRHVELEYTLTGSLPSGIKVQTLRIDSLQGVGEGVKPFKGIRYVTNVGQYIIR
jgi:hypothetical protein